MPENENPSGAMTPADLGLERRSRMSSAARWIIGLVVVLGIAAAGYSFFFSAAGSAVTYTTESVGKGDLKVIVTATGSLQPTNQIDISSELSGTIRSVFVDDNSMVKAGDKLAEFDADKLSATVESARARLKAELANQSLAEVTVEETRRDFERNTRLLERGAVSTHDFETSEALHRRAEASLESARANVESARADLRLNETNLAKTTIYSPINGMVLARNIDPGQSVASSFQTQVLFSIAEDLTRMEVQVDVDEADIGQVKVGQKAAFTVDAFPGRHFDASLEEVRFASEVVQGVVTYKAVLAVDNSEMILRPGMTATAEIVVEEVKDALLVPNQALRFSPPSEADADNRSFLEKLMPRPRRRTTTNATQTGDAAKRSVWILEAGVPKEVAIKSGATDGRMTEVLEGDLQPGQAVIVDSTTVNP
jgi:HlyD family secretion protein